MTGLKIADYSRGYPPAFQLAAAGFAGVIRYLPREGETGVLPINPAELADMRAHGLSAALVHQHRVKARPLQGAEAGRHDVAWALARARDLGIQSPRCVYFAVDFDTLGPDQWAAIREYFLGVAEVLPLAAIGAYGEYDLLDYLFARGAIAWGWQPYAWSKGHNQDNESRHPRAHLFQRLGQTTVAGVLCDVNDVLKPDFGAIDYKGDSVAWRVARSLDVLLRQLNSLAPRRSKASDGSIGDAAHASRSSDHNPWFGPGIVTARDFTHDPAGGLDCHWLAARLVMSGDPRIKYVIFDRRIWTPGAGWKSYTGANPHTAHLHLSVVASALCDNDNAWALGGSAPAPQPQPVPGVSNPGGRATIRQGSRGEDVKLVQRYLGLTADGEFGPATHAKVVAYQRAQGLTADGIVGPATWARVLSGLGGNSPVASPGGSAPAPAPRPARPTIRRGSTGDHVRTLQRWLALPADGVFGPATEARVKRYQAAHRLTADGIVGPRTWATMGL